MATANPIKIAGTTVPGVQVFEWTLTSADPVGDPILFAPYADRSVHILGDSWGGATCSVEGSLFDASSAFQVCTNQGGVSLNLVADDFSVVAEAALFMRPKLSVPGTGASIRVRILCRG